MSSCAGLPASSLSSTVPPSPPEKPHRMEIHGQTRNDPWFWMKDRENPEVIRHLQEENIYLENVLAPVKPLEKHVNSLEEKVRKKVLQFAE